MSSIKNFILSKFAFGIKTDLKELIYTSIPLILINITQIFLPIISNIFCGHLGTDQLDGVALANSLINMIVFVTIEGLNTACDTLMPQIFGGEDKKKVGLILQKAILICVLSSFGSATVLLNSRHLLAVITKETQVAIIADRFMVFFLPSIFFSNVSFVLTKYVQSQNIIYPLMVINFFTLIVNTVLHAIFIYGFKLGIEGAAISIDISTFIGLLVILFYIYYKKIYIDTWPGWSIECLYEWKLYLKLAIPGLFSLLIEWSNFEIGSVLSSSLDEIQLALMVIAQQVLFIAYQFPFGISIAANIRVGQLLGANRPEEAKNAAKVSYLITFVVIFPLMLIIISFSSLIPRVFNDDAEVISQCTRLLKLVAILHFFDALQGNGGGILRAIGGQFYASVLLFIGYYAIGSPIGLSLMFLTPLKVTGFLVGNLIGLIILNILQFIFIIRIDWKQKAQEAYDLSKIDANRAEPKSESQIWMVNPNFEDLTMQSLDNSQEKINPPVEQIEQTSVNEELTNNLRRLNIKRQIINRTIIFLIFILLFLTSILTHDLSDLTLIGSSNKTESNLTNTFFVNSKFLF